MRKRILLHNEPGNLAALYRLATFNRDLRRYDAAADWARHGLDAARSGDGREAGRFSRLLAEIEQLEDGGEPATAP